MSSALTDLKTFLRWDIITEVTAFRVVYVVAIVLLILLGWMYELTDPNAVDPMFLRYLLAGLAGGVLAWSYRPTGRRYLVRGVEFFLFVLVTWFLGLAILNDFSPNYSVGYFFVVIACLLVLGMQRSVTLAHLCFVVYTSVTAAAALLITPEAEVGRLILFTCLMSVLGLAVLAWMLLVKLSEALRHNKEHLAEAQRIAGLGNWAWDSAAETGDWSEEAYRLLGYEPGEVPPTPEQFINRVHSDDADEVRAYSLALLDGKDPGILRFRTEAEDGSERVLQLRGSKINGVRRPQFLGTVLDVTDQVEREAVLRRAKEKAEQMARLKDAFLANMSHEIRTPLTTIIGFAQVLDDEVDGEEKELLQGILEGGDRLLKTLNSVLDFAQLEAGEVDLELKQTDLSQVIRSVEREFRARAEQKGLAFDVQLPANPISCRADSTALTRALSNLLSNATKFTDDGSVTVAVQQAGEEVIITVSDTGIGISEDFLPRLFDEFEQESTGLDREHEGSGIGLTITKRIVELMEGSIEVESEKGKGTTFLVRLPAVHPEPASYAEPDFVQSDT